ncbi:MAG: DUF423 domain-containing protein [Bacteroidota bacterium]
MTKKFILIGLLFVTIAIMLGAIGAHYLERIGIEGEQINSFEVGVRYLFYSGVGALAIAGVASHFDFELRAQYRAILWGTVLFSGSIFLLVLTPVWGWEIQHVLGPVTPVGGLILIFGWLTLTVKFIRTFTAE